MQFDHILLISSILLLLAIFFNKLGGKLGLPSLVLFILVGIFAGTDGVLKINFDDYILAQEVGIVAISYILFMGGLSVDIKELKPVVKEGILLATFGVLITAAVVGIIVYYIPNLPLPMYECFLLGAIVSSTDAAAVFSILRSKNISLKGNLKPLLEFESGSNDPMAVFLTLGMISIITSKLDFFGLFIDFFKQFAIGIIFGYVAARMVVFIINKIKLEYASLYVVITLALVLFTYSSADMMGGNGFIAVYASGLTMAGMHIVYKKKLIKSHDIFAWISQIIMFTILGLLVNLKTGFSFAMKSVYVALILVFLARPIAVFLISFLFKRPLNEKLLISWVGLRGAAPIVLATFPLAAGLVYSSEIFNIVFFVVLISVLLQGTTIPLVAKLLKVYVPLLPYKAVYDYDEHTMNNKIFEVSVKEGSDIAGKKVFELNLPDNTLVSLIYNKGQYIVPKGDTEIEENDVLFIISDADNEQDIISMLKLAD